MEGIQGARSTNWKSLVRSNWKTSGSETRNPATATKLAQSLIARAFDEGMSSSTSIPANGVNRTIERIWSIKGWFSAQSYYHQCGKTVVRHGTRPGPGAGDSRKVSLVQRFRMMSVQVSPWGVRNSCQPPELRDSRAAATASVKVSPPCRSPTIAPGGSARASLTFATFVTMELKSTEKAAPTRFSEALVGSGPGNSIPLLSRFRGVEESTVGTASVRYHPYAAGGTPERSPAAVLTPESGPVPAGSAAPACRARLSRRDTGHWRSADCRRDPRSPPAAKDAPRR